jgi:hypothetical protein
MSTDTENADTYEEATSGGRDTAPRRSIVIACSATKL